MFVNPALLSQAGMDLRSAGGSWRTDEFVFIASEQNRLEDRLARECHRLLVCDTDSFATTLWHERYMGFPSPEVEALFRRGAGRICTS